MAAPKTETKIYVGIVLDFETGGLDCTTCAATQLAMQAVRLDTWQVLERYTTYIAPYNKLEIGGIVRKKVLRTRRELEQQAKGELMRYEPVALNYSAITMEQLQNRGIELPKVVEEILSFAARNTLSKGAQCKPVLIGQNTPFDVGFLQQIMAYAGATKEFAQTFAGTVDFWGNFQPHYIDTIDLARLAFANDPAVTSYKLELIAERFGVELCDAHDADADVTATLGIAAICSSRLRNASESVGITIAAEKTRKHFKI